MNYVLWVRRWIARQLDPDIYELAHDLYAHLKAMCEALHDKRYDLTQGPCPGCYDAVYEYEGHDA